MQFVGNKVNRRKSGLVDEMRKSKSIVDAINKKKDIFFKAITDRLELSLVDVEGKEFKNKVLTYKASISDPDGLFLSPPAGNIFSVKNIFYILLKYRLPHLLNIFIYFSLCVYVFVLSLIYI